MAFINYYVILQTRNDTMKLYLTFPLECENNHQITTATGSKCGNKYPCWCAGNICITGGTCKSGNALVDGQPICDNRWDLKDANVFCKTIGYLGVKQRTTNSR